MIDPVRLPGRRPSPTAAKQRAPVFVQRPEDAAPLCGTLVFWAVPAEERKGRTPRRRGRTGAVVEWPSGKKVTVPKQYVHLRRLEQQRVVTAHPGARILPAPNQGDPT